MVARSSKEKHKTVKTEKVDNRNFWKYLKEAEKS